MKSQVLSSQGINIDCASGGCARDYMRLVIFASSLLYGGPKRQLR